jgi:hypothetical protein
MIVSPMPNPQAGELAGELVVCPLIQYIRSYPPLLEAIPPSAEDVVTGTYLIGVTINPCSTKCGSFPEPIHIADNFALDDNSDHCVHRDSFQWGLMQDNI